MSSGPDREERAVAFLRTPEAIRERSENVFEAGLCGELEHFEIRLERLPDVAHEVVELTRQSYPALDIPYHSRFRHFGAGGVDRLGWLEQRLSELELAEDERLKSRFDLVVTSVLLDAGAGPAWRYREEETGCELARSEGLAVASLHLFLEGAFSDDPGAPLRATAEALTALSDPALAEGFQASANNPLVGVEGRTALLRSLGTAMSACPEWYGDEPRFGNLATALLAGGNSTGHGGRKGEGIDARELFSVLLTTLAPIWPARATLGGADLGDVFPHPSAGGEGPGRRLVPFHKLSQWLTYSLAEALELSGRSVGGLDALTGLAEYRNGGLFVDTGVLVPKHDAVTSSPHPHAPESTLVVEWRALTIALLDRLAEAMRDELGMDRKSLPLAKVLEGGTWHAGRLLATRLREDGSPPIRVASDGTLF